MSTQKGCKFCIRHGLPVLPVRPAVVAKDDALPHLPDNITVLTKAQGETAWTGRLLREGFLYIWSESGKRWINYFATSEGYYYPLPENGDVPPDIVNGKVKPCITQPEELASASLITLPVKPLGMKNGMFWFCWSEVEWTPAVRTKHEDASYRSQYMQSFDMDAWVNSGKADQVIAITALTETVAEYSSKARNSKVKEWSVAPWKDVKPQNGVNLQRAADKLYPGKGAMVLLQDPPAVLQDLSSLMNYELQRDVYERPEYQRELALSSSITGLKESMSRQFERDFLQGIENEDRGVAYGPFGFNTPGSVPENIYTHINDNKKKIQKDNYIKKKWANYEQYYDPSKVAEFQSKFDSILTAYNNKYIIPREAMYLGCIKGSSLQGYFIHNFDSANICSGIDYVHTLNYCIAGMQDKLATSKYFQKLIVGKVLDTTNIMARALALNQDEIAKKLDDGVQGSVDLFTLPWSFTADAIKETITRMSEGTAGVMGVYFGLLAGPIAASLQKMLNSNQVFHAVFSMGIFTNKAIVTLEKTGTYKQFVSEVVSLLAKDSGLAGKVNGDRLRTYVSKELRRLGIDGLPMEGEEMKKFLVMIDMDKVEELKGLSPKARAIALSKLLRRTGDVEAEQFARWQGAVQRGMNKSRQAMPFTLGIVSGILQTIALWKTASYEETTLTEDQKEACARFWLGVSAASSTGLSIIEAGIRQFQLFTNASSRYRILSSESFLKGISKLGARIGVVVGVITAFLDLYHSVDEAKKGNTGLSRAYFLSGVSGIWLAISLLYAIPVVGTVIATIILVGAAVYLAFNNQDNIQKWLEQCLWRKIPVDITKSKIEQENILKYTESNIPIWPSREMEMHELKLALGEGGV